MSLPTILCYSNCHVKNAWPALTVKEKKLLSEEDEEDKEFCCLGPLWTRHIRGKKLYNSFRPFFTVSSDPENGRQSAYFLYPLFRRHESKHDVRWSGIFAKSRYPKNPKDIQKRRIFLIFDYRKEGIEGKPSRNIFPISGHLDHFLGNDSFSWVMFPAWIKSEKQGETRYAMLWPFIHWQNGETAGGGSFWPIWGHTWSQNNYDRRYWLWPLIFSHKDDLNEAIPHIKHGFLPFYSAEESAHLKSKTYCWPFFGYTDKFDKKYHETRYFWPIFVQAKGDDALVNRWAPFYSHSIHKGLDKKWFLWPFVKKKSWDEKDLHIEQKQFLFFVVWTNRQISLDANKPFAAHKTHCWPFLSHWDNGNGCKQFQMLSPLEPFFQHNEIIRELYSPLFAFFRYEEKSPQHRMASFLFNLITYERSPEERTFTLGPFIATQKGENISSFKILGGLLGYEKKDSKKTLKLLWFNV